MWSGLNGLVIEERFGHTWSWVNGLVMGKKFGLVTYERILVIDHWFGHD